MKTNVSKRDAIAQAMDWLGQLREDGRAEATLGGKDEATVPAVTAPPAPVTAPAAPAVGPPPPAIGPPAPAIGPPAPAIGPPAPAVGDRGNRRNRVAITARAAIGDELRIPIAWCDMGACISYYEHPEALGEADIRDRAIAAGWRVDALGRLACPSCQQSGRWFWTTHPVVLWDRGRAVTAATLMAAMVRAEATGSTGGEAEPGQPDRA
jgi:hypothetical protein